MVSLTVRKSALWTTVLERTLVLGLVLFGIVLRMLTGVADFASRDGVNKLAPSNLSKLKAVADEIDNCVFLFDVFVAGGDTVSTFSIVSVWFVLWSNTVGEIG
ncbi:MAG: hypothetical protein ACLRFP_02605 [Alphaproteobacteria bacterium]